MADDDYQVNIWDFGGQAIHFATHQFFLTKRSVYQAGGRYAGNIPIFQLVMDAGELRRERGVAGQKSQPPTWQQLYN